MAGTGVKVFQIQFAFNVIGPSSEYFCGKCTKDPLHTLWKKSHTAKGSHRKKNGHAFNSHYMQPWRLKRVWVSQTLEPARADRAAQPFQSHQISTRHGGKTLAFANGGSTSYPHNYIGMLAIVLPRGAKPLRLLETSARTSSWTSPSRKLQSDRVWSS